MRSRGWGLLAGAAILLATSLLPARALPDPPSIDPPVGQLVVTRLVNTVRQLFTVDPQLGNYQQITDMAGGVQGPDWSPDGTRIAFNSAGAIWVVPATGGTPTRLTTPPSGTVDYDARWSPDGQTIAFVRSAYTTYTANIHLMAADGTGLRPLTPTPARQYEPRWSPDGFLSYLALGRHWQLYLADPGGNSSAPLVLREGEFHIGGASWRPDGRLSYLVIAEYEGGYDSTGDTVIEAFTANGDGTAPTRWFTGPTTGGSWSNDSRCIAYGDGFDASPDYEGYLNDPEVRIACGGVSAYAYLGPTDQPSRPLISGVLYGALQPAWKPAGPVPADPAVVDRVVAGGDGVTTWSSGNLVVGQRYEIVARGTYAYGPGGARADAECSSGSADDPVFIPRRHQWQDLNGDPLDLYVGHAQHDDWIADGGDPLGCFAHPHLPAAVHRGQQRPHLVPAAGRGGLGQLRRPAHRDPPPLKSVVSSDVGLTHRDSRVGPWPTHG